MRRNAQLRLPTPCSGSSFVWSRFVGLDRSFWHDELVTVRGYVRTGPYEILVGPYIPNNHELFSLLGWATSSLFGESEVALRLWSALPFVAGVIVVTAWLHVRLGAPSGLLYLFLATVSPLLLDITRQARGYGLAFLAMSVLTIAALEANRSPRTWLVVAFFGAGLVGTWTLPHFGIAFAATSAVLLTNRDLRRRAAIGVTVSLLAIVAWYGPHVDDLLESSRQEYGAPIAAAWVITAPIDQILMPAMRWIDETLFDPSLGALVIVAALGLLIGSSPLIRRRDSSLVLSVGVVATIVTLWVTRTHVAPRFFSFLLVPLLILLASGIAAILTRFATSRRVGVRTLDRGDDARTCRTHLGSAHGAGHQAATRVDRRRSRDDPRARTTICTGVRLRAVPQGHRALSRPTRAAAPDARSSASGLSGSRDAVLVSQPWILPPATIPCTQRRGVRHVRFRAVRTRRRDERVVHPSGLRARERQRSRFQSCALTLHPNSSRSTSRWSPKPRPLRSASKSSSPVSDHVRTQMESAVETSDARAP